MNKVKDIKKLIIFPASQLDRHIMLFLKDLQKKGES